MFSRWFGLAVAACCFGVAATGWSQNLEVATIWNKDIPNGSPASDQDDTNYYAVPVGGSLSRLLTLHNTDESTTLTIVDFLFADSVDFGTDTSDNVKTIPPGETQNLSVLFHPTTAGQKLSTLTIPSNDLAGPYIINLSGNAVNGDVPPTADVAVHRGKEPKAKKNKTTGLLDVQWSVPVANSGTVAVTTPTLNIYLSSSPILQNNPTPVQSIVLKPLAAGKNGKEKKKNVKVKLTGLPNEHAFIFGEAVPAGQPNLKSHINALFDDFNGVQ